MAHSRRSFLAGSGLLLSAGCLGRSGGRKTWLVPDASPEHPDEHQRATLRAMADTFLPGWDGAPGADDTDALATLIDPDYGLNPYVTELCADLDDWCWLTYGAEFVKLDRGDRTRALEQRMGLRGRALRSAYQEAYQGALALTKINYYGGLLHGAGQSYIGFPGPSTGYAPDSAAGAYRCARTGVDIPNTVLAGVTCTIAVAGRGAIAQLLVDLGVTHPDPSDLRIELRSPAGTVHPLWQQQRGPRRLRLERAPVTAFRGEPAAGTYTLHLVDAVGAAAGRLDYWQLVLRTDLDP
jgi:hypothetical protein